MNIAFKATLSFSVQIGQTVHCLNHHNHTMFTYPSYNGQIGPFQRLKGLGYIKRRLDFFVIIMSLIGYFKFNVTQTYVN